MAQTFVNKPLPPPKLSKITPQRLGLIWEIFVRNYYLKLGYAAFRVSASGPPCDIIAFKPPPNLKQYFPKLPIDRSKHLERIARKQYRKKFGYETDLIPSILDGFYYDDGQLTSLQTHLLAFKEDHLRFIWTRKKSKKKPYRIWDKIFLNIQRLEFIECKAVKNFDITMFRRTKQFNRQIEYAIKSGASYITVHKTDKGAMQTIHLYDKSVAVGFIIKWDEILIRWI
ncbi:MAG: hypothetical protein ACFFG0_10680 [Candidatus Thorarchaeota archaeon]